MAIVFAGTDATMLKAVQYPRSLDIDFTKFMSGTELYNYLALTYPDFFDTSNKCLLSSTTKVGPNSSKAFRYGDSVERYNTGFRLNFPIIPKSITCSFYVGDTFGNITTAMNFDAGLRWFLPTLAGYYPIMCVVKVGNSAYNNTANSIYGHTGTAYWRNYFASATPGKITKVLTPANSWFPTKPMENPLVFHNWNTYTDGANHGSYTGYVFFDKISISFV
jgi:hypothetical protein